MEKVFVDINYLTFCWQDDNDNAIYYLDKDTGSIILLEDDLEDIVEMRTEIELELSRYLFIPKQERKHTELDLSDYVNTIADDTIKGALQVALEQKEKLFAARAVFKNYPDEKARWEKFAAAAASSRARRWLGINGIEPIE
jgi:hypothetical protein